MAHLEGAVADVARIAVEIEEGRAVVPRRGAPPTIEGDAVGGRDSDDLHVRGAVLRRLRHDIRGVVDERALGEEQQHEETQIDPCDPNDDTRHSAHYPVRLAFPPPDRGGRAVMR